LIRLFLIPDDPVLLMLLLVEFDVPAAVFFFFRCFS
jgi:hypothetical protein